MPLAVLQGASFMGAAVLSATLSASSSIGLGPASTFTSDCEYVPPVGRQSFAMDAGTARTGSLHRAVSAPPVSAIISQEPSKAPMESFPPVEAAIEGGLLAGLGIAICLMVWRKLTGRSSKAENTDTPDEKLPDDPRSALAALAKRYEQRGFSSERQFLNAFERVFRRLSQEEQEHLRKEVLDRTMHYFTHTLSNETSAEGMHIPFPFVNVPIEEMETINALFEIFHRGRDDLPRPCFVPIDVEQNNFIFGLATIETFHDVPVVNYEKIITSREPAREEGGTTVAGFVVPTRPTFIVSMQPFRFERYVKKIEAFPLTQLLCNKAAQVCGADSIQDPKFQQKAASFHRVRLLGHEHGHLRSYNDPRVAHLVADPPKLVHQGKELLHPSFRRFHVLAELYAEILGAMRSIVASKDTAWLLLFFARHVMNLSLPKIKGKTYAFAILPAIVPHLSFDASDGRARVDWEGLTRELDALEAHVLELFRYYDDLSGAGVEEWAREKEQFFLPLNHLLMMLGGKAGDPSKLPTLEHLFREHALKAFQEKVLLPRSRIYGELKEFRKKHTSYTDNRTQRESEEYNAQQLETLYEKLRSQEAAKRLRAHIEEFLNGVPIRRGDLPSYEGASDHSYLQTVNEIFAAEKIMWEMGVFQDASERGFQEDKDFVTFPKDDRVIWESLHNQGIIDAKGRVPLDMKLKENSFDLPKNYERDRLDIFRRLKFEQLRRKKALQMTQAEIDAMRSRIEQTLAAYPDDDFLHEVAAKITWVAAPKSVNKSDEASPLLR